MYHFLLVMFRYIHLYVYFFNRDRAENKSTQQMQQMYCMLIIQYHN